MVLTGQYHPPGFADWSTPEWVVISGGDSDNRPTVRQAYAERGSQVLHTALSGAVHVAIESGRLAVEPWRQSTD